MFDAVIFDWDGTLADTRQAILIAFQTVLRKAGCDVTDEFLDKLIGIGARNMFKKALEAADISFDEEDIDRLVNEKNRLHAELASKIRLFEGARDLLDSLRSKVKVALATMSSREVINRLMRRMGIQGYFDYVITADEVTEPKPDPEVFLACARELRCRPERCVVIEDSIFGVVAARKANMKCIAIPSGAYSKDDLRREEPDLIVDSIKERGKILDYILVDQHEC